MRRVLAFVLVLGIATVGYLYYKQSRVLPPEEDNNLLSRLVITQKNSSLDGLTSVLGAATTKVWNAARDTLDSATGGTAEPIINKAVQDLRTRVKDLPSEQYEKVKYEFCKDVLVSPVPLEDTP